MASVSSNPSGRPRKALPAEASSTVHSVSGHARPHSRPVGEAAGHRRPVARGIFGLRGAATETPPKFPHAVSSAAHASSFATVPPAASYSNSRSLSPPKPRITTAQQQQEQQERSPSPMRRVQVGNCHINPHTKLTPSVQASSTAVGRPDSVSPHRASPTIPSDAPISGARATAGALMVGRSSPAAAAPLAPAIGGSKFAATRRLPQQEAAAPSPASFCGPESTRDVGEGWSVLGSSVGAAASDDGATLLQLAPAHVVELDLKSYDIDAPIPRHTFKTCSVPRFRITCEPPALVRCKGVPLHPSPPGTVADTTAASFVLCLADEASQAQRAFPGLVQHVIGVEDAGMDRALEYHTFADTPELFSALPQIDAADGTLTFSVVPGVFGETTVHVRLADNASVDEWGRVMTSDPQSFRVIIEREQAGTANASVGHPRLPGRALNTSSSSAAAAAGSLPSPPARAAARAAGRGHSPTAPHHTTVTVPLESVDSGRAAHSSGNYAFPNGTPHALRYDVVALSHRLVVHEHAAAQQQPTSALLETDDLMSDGAIVPSFSAVVCDVEKLKLVHLAQERDRLSGDPAEEEGLEEQLLQRIKAEEAASGGGDGAGEVGGSTAVELCPLLMRLAQLQIAAGASRQGDAVETLERLCRIRLAAVGLGNFADIAASDAIVGRIPTGESVALSTSMAPGGHGLHSLTAALTAPLKLSMVGASSPGGPSSVGGAAASNSRSYEALLQSLTVLATYFKLLGRFREALEFFEYALGVAAGYFGFDSVQYTRALTQIAEIHYYIGEYSCAITLYEKAIASAEVQFGPEAPSTIALLHLLGVCCVAAGQAARGVAQHERALAARRKIVASDSDGGAEFTVAESLAFLAAAEHRREGNARSIELVNEALDVLKQFDTSQSVEYSLARCTVMSIVARVKLQTSVAAGSREGVDHALALLDECVGVAARMRGLDSLEASTFMAELASARLRLGRDVPKVIGELRYVLAVFLASLGPRHHYTARTQLLLAQALMDKDLRGAKELAENAASSLQHALDPHHRDIGVACDVLARVCMACGEDHRALQLVKKAYVIASRANHGPHLAPLEALLCGAHTRVPDVPLPADVFQRIEERAQQVRLEHGETSRRIIVPYLNLAEGFFLLRDFTRAHHALSRVLKVADSTNFIFLLGHLFKPATQLSVSELQERNRLASDRIDVRQAQTFAVTLFAIGATFEAEGLVEDAQSTYLQAHAALEIAGLARGLGVVECLFALARILFRQQCYGDALAFSERAYNTLLEDHPQQQVFVQTALRMIHTIQTTLHASGATLVRHLDSRHRFATYI